MIINFLKDELFIKFSFFQIQIFYINICIIKILIIIFFKYCLFLSGYVGEVDKILDNWKFYKMSVLIYGVILLDLEMKYVSY